MDKPEPVHPTDDSSAIDNRLRPLLSAEGERYDLLVQEVIETHAAPLIKKIINAKLRPHSDGPFSSSDAEAAEDLVHEAIAGLMTHLRLSRQNPADYGIRSLDEFVAKTSLNAYNKYLRGKYPRRHRLKKQLYYLLHKLKDPGLWKDGVEWVAGFLCWKQTLPVQRHSPMLDQLREDEWDFVRAKLDGKPLPEAPTERMLVGLFEWINHPLEYDLLVDTVADLLKIKDQPVVANPDDPNEKRPVEGRRQDPPELARVDRRKYLKRLWAEITALPIKQRWALLCSLRDGVGDGLINELPSCGIATPQQIAVVLELPLEELGELWARFPLKDAEIGARWDITSQQVINLRKSARERLARRMDKRLK